MLNIILEILALLVIGWVLGAEIGSWFGIQPRVMKLPYEHFEYDIRFTILRQRLNLIYEIRLEYDIRDTYYDSCA